jgi:hypothetical protein
MSELQARAMLWRIKHEQRFGIADHSMIFNYQFFFNSRGNNYIDDKLRDARDRLWDSFEELNLFMQLKFEVLKQRGLFKDKI